MFRLTRSSKGFTLVELMIVLAVLAVLAAVVIPNVSGYLGRGKERAWDADRDILQSAVDAWRTDIRNRAGNPWPVLTSPTVPADLQPGPNPNQTTRGY
ncbi:MAG: prepilin-type N-terminal cleavage/methylation domain-containing protein, partial [Chloroflexi bacterium]|nr:prepilin-type N-terminal cleavage/methylation domain-containing protein [Chloroflexota bacterium]